MRKKIYPFLFLTFAFLVPRLILMVTYPPFNDESIHLAWARAMTAKKEAHFASMIWGGKQPLPFWLFALALAILPQYPFIAGRLVSVLFAFLGLWGIFLTSKTIANSKAAIFASLSYAISPLVIFFGSQSLMEIMVFTLAVWLFYFLLKMFPLLSVEGQGEVRKRQLRISIKNSIIIGLLLGIGFFIKSTFAIFVGLTVLTLALTAIRERKLIDRRKKIRLIGLIGLQTAIITLTATVVLLPLFNHPSFAALVEWNRRYGFSLVELINLPIKNWQNNALAGTVWYLYYLTPTFILFSFWPFIALLVSPYSKRIVKLACGRRQKNNSFFLSMLMLLVWFILSLGATIILARNTSSRHFVPASFPLFILFGIGLSQLETLVQYGKAEKLSTSRHSNLPRRRENLAVTEETQRASLFTQDNKTAQLVLFLLAFVPQFILTSILVLYPPAFFNLLGKLTPVANESYLVAGWQSGYAVPEAITFLKEKSRNQNIIVLVRRDGGNPEDAIITAFWQHPHVQLGQVTTLNKKQTQKFIQEISSIKLPVFFVSRGPQYAGLDQYLTQLARFDKPWGDEFVGIFYLRLSRSLNHPLPPTSQLFRRPV